MIAAKQLENDLMARLVKLRWRILQLERRIAKHNETKSNNSDKPDDLVGSLLR